MPSKHALHILFRGLNRLAVLALAVLLILYFLGKIGVAPTAMTAGLMHWIKLSLLFALLFWGLAFLIDPFRKGAVPVDALYDRARLKLRWRRRLSRAEKLCYDAMSLFTPIAEQGLTDGIAILGPDRARATLYALREIYLEKAHDTLSKALDAYEINPDAFPAHSPAFEATLREAGFSQLPGRLGTRLEELMRNR